MKSNYKRLGDYIRQVDVRNKDLRSKKLLGINIDKFFMPSVANIIGTDLSNYKLIEKGQFACNPMHVGRDERIPVSLYLEDDYAIVSPAYFVFEVSNNSLLNKYLMLWFRRSEFDRECWFYTDASVRGGITWEDFCDMKLPIPSIEEQEKIIDAYETIEKRIAIKKKINDNLEKQAQLIFKEQFESYYDNNLPEGYKIIELGQLCKISGGKRLPVDSELLNIPTRHPYIKVRDIGNSRYIFLTNQFQYIDEETYSDISCYIVNADDLIISIVGTIGLIGKVHKSLDKANLTENCVKLSELHNVTTDYLYYTLCYKKRIKEIEFLTVGAVQPKLPIYNIQSIKILLPPQKEIDIFQKKIDAFNKKIEINIIEINILAKLQSKLLAKLTFDFINTG